MVGLNVIPTGVVVPQSNEYPVAAPVNIKVISSIASPSQISCEVEVEVRVIICCGLRINLTVSTAAVH